MGPVGPKGDPGPQGPPGMPGEPGKDATVDIQAIVQQVLAEMPQQEVTIDIQQIADEVIRQLPPVRMQIQHPNGEVFEQSAPLGKPIAVKLVPVK